MKGKIKNNAPYFILVPPTLKLSAAFTSLWHCINFWVALTSFWRLLLYFAMPLFHLGMFLTSFQNGMFFIFALSLLHISVALASF